MEEGLKESCGMERMEWREGIKRMEWRDGIERRSRRGVEKERLRKELEIGMERLERKRRCKELRDEWRVAEWSCGVGEALKEELLSGGV